MTNRARFESRLKALAGAPVRFAGSKDQQSNEIILELIRGAEERLANNPSLFSGDPNREFTYEDPILATAAWWERTGAKMASRVGTASANGEELRNRYIWKWIMTGVRAWWSRGDQTYVMLAGRTPQESVLVGKENVRIAVVGDGGYSGYAQKNVIRYITERHHEKPFDLIIHLGDTYFAGTGQEMFYHFLSPYSAIGPDIYTLCGNHDLYYGGGGYNHALNVLRQPGRYFCIETPQWRIACLDTSLGAERLLRDDGLLDDGQLIWLDKLLSSSDKPLILMSHHFIISGWGPVASSLNLQLHERVKDRARVFAWYWGHEHGCATYDNQPHGFYGACVGNGAFLETWKKPHLATQPTWYAKGSCRCYGPEESGFWPHGYLEMELTANQITENYHLEGKETYERVLKI